MRHVSYALLLFVIISVLLVGYSLRDMAQLQPVAVSDFATCVAKGYPILESHPRQCKTPQGKTFVEPLITQPVTEPSSDPEQNINVFEPAANQQLTSPFFLLGEARVFENVLSYRLSDASGKVLAEGNLTARSPDVGQFGQFDKTIMYRTTSKEGILEVFSNSPKDGSEINTVRIPVRF